MNGGQITKTFIASGENSERALSNFNDNWDYGFVETIYVPHHPFENVSSVKMDESKLSKGFNLMLIDNEAAAIKRAIEYISHVNQACSGVDILGIMMVDLIDSVLSKELINLHEEINKITSADFIQVNQCDPILIESLIAMYAHLYCGFSNICLDLQDLYDTLRSGYYFKASQVAVTTIYELPFAVYQAAINISIVAKELSEIKGIVLVIVSNEELVDLSILSACVDMLRGFYDKNINTVFHTNIQPENTNSIHLGVVFDELGIQVLPIEGISNDKTLDTPDFLRKSKSN